MNNSAAIGYALMVLKDWGLTQDELKEFESDMRHMIDMVDEEAAEDVYNSN